mmetsp:Transcript_45535/g.114573  ORF Transcript_45535/g.114573 Transcript_45535/m.114573 type:complete len:195 (+) Transcript_45535:100-684(+)
MGKIKRRHKFKSVRPPNKNKPHRTAALPYQDETVRLTWDKNRTLKQNFRAMGLASDANSVVREGAPSAPKPMIDLKVPIAKPKPPPKLTRNEQWYCRDLIRKYGDDYLAMARDIKLNNYQHTPKKLKKMCTLYLVTCGAGSEIMSPSSQKGDEKKLTECSKPATVLGAPGTTPPTTAKKLRRRRRKSQPATTEQ